MKEREGSDKHNEEPSSVSLSLPQAELLREEIVSFFLAGISMTIYCISIDIIINSYVLIRILFDVAEGWMSEKVIIISPL